MMGQQNASLRRLAKGHTVINKIFTTHSSAHQLHTNFLKLFLKKFKNEKMKDSYLVDN